MARAVGPIFTGSANASSRGGSTSLGVKSAFRVGGPEFRSGPISSFDAKIADTSRSASLNNFLKGFTKISRPDQIGFLSTPATNNGFESVKSLGSVIKNIPEKGNDGGLCEAQVEVPRQKTHSEPVRVRPSVIWFGSPIRNFIPENGDVSQPNVVEKSISFALPRVERVKQKSVIKDSAPNINEVRVEVVQEIAKSQAEVSVAEKVDAGGGVGLLPRRQLSIVEEVGLAMMVRKARMSMLMPKSQAIPMSGVETAPALMPAIEAASSGQNAEDKTLTPEVKAEIPKKVNQLRRKTKVIQQEKKDLSPEKKRVRFVERDLEMNAWRLKALVKGYLELAPHGEVEGAALAAQSHIGSSRELRSVFLDQRGYRDRTDGSQKRMELFLGSVKTVNKEQLKVIVNEHTAVKETYEKPREMATVREVNEVVNEPKNLDTRFEPFEIEEVVEEARVMESQVYESKKIELNPKIFDEKPVSEAVREDQVISVENLMRPVELIGHVNQIWGTIPLQRRELVLN